MYTVHLKLKYVLGRVEITMVMSLVDVVLLSWTRIVVHNRDHPLLHIIIIIIHISSLFHTASADLILYFQLKPMGVCLLYYWPALLCFKSFILPVCKLQPLFLSFQSTLMITKPYKCTSNSLWWAFIALSTIQTFIIYPQAFL